MSVERLNLNISRAKSNSSNGSVLFVDSVYTEFGVAIKGLHEAIRKQSPENAHLSIRSVSQYLTATMMVVLYS